MNKKPINTAGSDFRDPQAPKVSPAPFASSWENSRPMASSGAAHEGPGGVLSPLQLNGTGLKKGQK